MIDLEIHLTIRPLVLDRSLEQSHTEARLLCHHHTGHLITMTFAVVDLATLKNVKNSVIGNPTAKASLAKDESFVARQAKDQPN